MTLALRSSLFSLRTFIDSPNNQRSHDVVTNHLKSLTAHFLDHEKRTLVPNDLKIIQNPSDPSLAFFFRKFVLAVVEIYRKIIHPVPRSSGALHASWQRILTHAFSTILFLTEKKNISPINWRFISTWECGRAKMAQTFLILVPSKFLQFEFFSMIRLMTTRKI